MFSGSIQQLNVTPRAFLPMRTVDTLELVEGKGIVGDRYFNGAGFYSDLPEDGRQVTFFELETLDALRRDHGIALDPDQHRRNITTRGVPLNHLVGVRFRVGSALVEGTRLSTPCRHIEQITGQEIFTLLLNRSGLHARIVRGGLIRAGDVIIPA
ncbi:MOSC domain-containing protein [Rhizobium leguminosarum]|uniref:MOSC domain-containing protein n=1 Tax=Rhizobium leguminosarum TaxID=384 RepID=UPI003F9DE080